MKTFKITVKGRNGSRFTCLREAEKNPFELALEAFRIWGLGSKISIMEVRGGN